MYVPITYLDQAVPSPWGMPAYEEFDKSTPADFFFNWDEAESVSTPDFTGKRVKSYLRWLKLANTLTAIKKAFPECPGKSVGAESIDPFDCCPAEFERSLLQGLSELCSTDEGKKLFSKAKRFQKLSVQNGIRR